MRRIAFSWFVLIAVGVKVHYHVLVVELRTGEVGTDAPVVTV